MNFHVCVIVYGFWDGDGRVELHKHVSSITDLLNALMYIKHCWWFFLCLTPVQTLCEIWQISVNPATSWNSSPTSNPTPLLSLPVVPARWMKPAAQGGQQRTGERTDTDIWVPNFFQIFLSRTLLSQNAGLFVVPGVSKSRIGVRAFSYKAPTFWECSVLPCSRSVLKFSDFLHLTYHIQC